jgi:hypothetical protein
VLNVMLRFAIRLSPPPLFPRAGNSPEHIPKISPTLIIGVVFSPFTRTHSCLKASGVYAGGIIGPRLVCWLPVCKVFGLSIDPSVAQAIGKRAIGGRVGVAG